MSDWRKAIMRMIFPPDEQLLRQLVVPAKAGTHGQCAANCSSRRANLALHGSPLWRGRQKGTWKRPREPVQLSNLTRSARRRLLRSQIRPLDHLVLRKLAGGAAEGHLA